MLPHRTKADAPSLPHDLCLSLRDHGSVVIGATLVESLGWKEPRKEARLTGAAKKSWQEGGLVSQKEDKISEFRMCLPVAALCTLGGSNTTRTCDLTRSHSISVDRSIVEKRVAGTRRYKNERAKRLDQEVGLQAQMARRIRRRRKI
jgi:hypothetical protein